MATAVFEEFRRSSSGAMDKARLVFTRSHSSQQEPNTDNNKESEEQSQQSDVLEELSEYCPTLTFQQRLIGFASCFSLGYLIAFFSFRFFFDLVEGNPIPYALNYSFGHVLQLAASTFLCGPKRQFKNMFDDSRRTTSIVYLSCLVVTFVVVFLPMPGKYKLLLLIVTLLVQFCASFWYTLSYIPYGRRTALKIIKRTLGIEEQADYSIPGVMITSA